MRSPEQVLKALNKHGKVSDYKFERLYRILFNEEMFHTFAGSVNTYDVLNADKLIISVDAAKKLEEVLG